MTAKCCKREKKKAHTHRYLKHKDKALENTTGGSRHYSASLVIEPELLDIITKRWNDMMKSSRKSSQKAETNSYPQLKQYTKKCD